MSDSINDQTNTNTNTTSECDLVSNNTEVDKTVNSPETTQIPSNKEEHPADNHPSTNQEETQTKVDADNVSTNQTNSNNQENVVVNDEPIHKEEENKQSEKEETSVIIDQKPASQEEPVIENISQKKEEINVISSQLEKNESQEVPEKKTDSFSVTSEEAKSEIYNEKKEVDSQTSVKEDTNQVNPPVQPNETNNEEGPNVEDITKVEEHKSNYNTNETSTTELKKENVNDQNQSTSNPSINLSQVEENTNKSSEKNDQNVPKPNEAQENIKVENENKDKANQEEELKTLRLKEEFNRLNNLKNEAGKTFKTDVDKAFEEYTKILHELDSLMFNIPPPITQPTKAFTELFTELLNLKKLLLSNVSLCHFKKRRYKEAISIDDFIIKNLDPNFVKSYLRMIQSQCELKDLDSAKRTYEFMKLHFSPETLKNDICRSIINEYEKLEAERKKRAEDLNKEKKSTVENTIKVEPKTNDPKKEDEKKPQELEAKKIRRPRWYNWFFGGFMFLGSFAAIGYLILNRSKFMK